jgi:hypothetical protein
VSWSFKSVDSSRQVWEDRINASFEHVRSPERVCAHADVTVSATPYGSFVATGLLYVECDYCPASSVATEEHGPLLPPPYYFRDDDPLKI